MQFQLCVSAIHEIVGNSETSYELAWLFECHQTSSGFRRWWKIWLFFCSKTRTFLERVAHANFISSSGHKLIDVYWVVACAAYTGHTSPMPQSVCLVDKSGLENVSLLQHRCWSSVITVKSGHKTRQCATALRNDTWRTGWCDITGPCFVLLPVLSALSCKSYAVAPVAQGTRRKIFPIKNSLRSLCACRIKRTKTLYHAHSKPQLF